MAKLQRAKRANKHNPRVDRNIYNMDNNIIELNPSKKNKITKKHIDLIPKTISQEQFIDALMDDDQIYVIAHGSAGSGKTYLTAKYFAKGYLEGKYEKIILIRSSTTLAGESIGHLPGNIREKIGPFIQSFLDVLEEDFTKEEIEKMLENEIIQLLPAAFLRGRNLQNSLVFIDECQSLNSFGIVSVMTRIGSGSKLVMAGDIQQSDRNDKDNGLLDLVRKIENKPIGGIKIIEFTKKDVQRNKIISDILSIYGME